jgi:hypothetical protein
LCELPSRNSKVRMVVLRDVFVWLAG